VSEQLESAALIIAPPCPIAPVELPNWVLVEIEKATALECLLGKVDSTEENQRAVDAQGVQKALLNKMEKARKVATAPYLEKQRAIGLAHDRAVLELEKECARLQALTEPWGIKERRRIADQAEAQRQDLLRIEREKQAEIDRLAREQRAREEEARRIQAEDDRQVRLAQERADQAAREATSAKQRAEAKAAQEEAARLAETNRLAAVRLAEVQKAEAIEVAAKVERVEEAAAGQTYLLSRPIHADTAKGQKLVRDWDIEITNPYELAKFHPTAVTIKPLLGVIKELLREGIVVKGITATETVNTAVRAKRERAAIEA
jgi:hypothetical protein